MQHTGRGAGESDSALYAHCRRVAAVAAELADRLELPSENRRRLREAAEHHHDVGHENGFEHLVKDVCGAAPPMLLRPVGGDGASADEFWPLLELCCFFAQRFEFLPYELTTVDEAFDELRQMAQDGFFPSAAVQALAAVIRSGFGLYYNVHQLNNYTILNLNPPLSGSSAFAQTATAGRLNNTNNPFTFANPFGAVNNTSIINANTLNPDNYQPRVIQWSLDIQRQLPGRSVVTVGYVGSKGVHVDNTVELNNPDPGLSSLPTTPQQRRPIQFVIDGPGGPLRPLSRLRWLDSGNNSWYHGLQINYEKRMTKGLQFNVAYTFSQSLGEGYGRNESFGGTSNTYQNPRDRAAEKGRYPFDVRHNAVINFLYELPAPASLNKGAGKFVFGGWQVNGIGTFHTGLPFTVAQSNTLNTFNSVVRPDRLSSGELANPTVNQWFDTEAFRLVTCTVNQLADRCHYGSAGNSILDGPGFKNIDFSVLKNIPIRENFRVQFRAEMFNLFNTPQFNLPNRTLNLLPSATDPNPVQGGRQNGPGAIGSLISPMRVIQFGLKVQF